MAEWFQTVGFALDAAREILTAARSVAEAKKVLQRIADRANLIEASLQSIEDILIDMKDRLQPMMPPDKYDRLQTTLIMCVTSCQKELDESFSLRTRDGTRATQATIMRRLRIAANGEKIHEDRATLDSIILHLHMSITTVNTALSLTRIETRESMESSQSDGGSRLQSALEKVNETTEHHNKQVQLWQRKFESDDMSKIDSAIDLELSDDEQTFSPEEQLALERKAEENEWSIIHQALYDSKTKIVDLLLRRQPELKGAIDAKGQTPLHHCSNVDGIPDALQKAEILVQHGADVNSEDHSDPKRTPLCLAVRFTCTQEREAMVQLLVTSGAEVDINRLPSRWTDYPSLMEYRSR